MLQGRGLRGSILDAVRTPFRWPPLESWLLSRTIGADFSGLSSRLPPNPWQYPSGLSRQVQRCGLTLSLDLSDLVDWYIFWGFRDPSVERLVDLCPAGADVLDVGANIGFTALRLARRTTGRVIGVEADPANYARCMRNLALNAVPNLTVLNLGVSDHEGPGTISRPNAHNLGMNRIGGVGAPITLVTLDKLVDEQDLKRVALVKIDVEGHEGHVLRGAKRTLETSRPVLFMELSDYLLCIQGSSGPELVSQVQSFGYEVRSALTATRIEPAAASGSAMDVICTPLGQ